jgi:predicted TIM-barrel fold metal-dependent hydrolase
MIIDAHNHPEWYDYSLDKFIANMDQYGISQTWLLSWEVPLDEYDLSYQHVIPDKGPDGPISFRHCLDFKERAPDRFILGYAPDPRRPHALERFRQAVETQEVRIFGELKLRMMLDNPDAVRIYRYCGEQGIPVTVHLDYELPAKETDVRPNWWYGGGIEALARSLALCPETIFLGHAPGFWAHISGDNRYLTESYPSGPVLPGGRLIQLLDTFPNLYCDLSAGSGHNALNRDPAFARHFILTYQDRLLYARDYFDNRHQEFLNSLDLPAPVLEKIYSGNAIRLLSAQRA